LRYNVRLLLSVGCGRNRLRNRFLIVIGLIIAAMALPALALRAFAQDTPEKGGHEVQFWTGGGGPSMSGGVHDINMWSAGMRYGWILTSAIGPKGIRGRFEYAVDAIPVFWFFQPGGTAYGAGVSPITLKWNFEAGSRVVPYVEANGAFVITTRATPPGVSNLNFASSGAIGANFLTRRMNVSIDLRLMHVSDAGMTSFNPGINSLQLRLSVGKFLRSN
jgi:hypothetical protein